MAMHPELNERARGWLRHMWRKATTPDDWSRNGEPRPWWDRYSTAPMLNFPRFDLSESSYSLALMADATPAWREVYAQILDQLIARHTTFWAAVDWLTFIGHDPKRRDYPKEWKGFLVPEHLWGEYDAPGWTANGVAPWGLQADPIGSDGNLFFRGFLNLMLAIYRYVSGDNKWDAPFPVAGLEDQTFEWTHPRIADFLSTQWDRRPEGPHCENTKIWPFCLSAAGLGLQLTDRVNASSHYWVVERWFDEFLKKKYMAVTPDGRMEWMALYYDPEIDHLPSPNPLMGLAPCWYIIPQDRKLAEIVYQTVVTILGWNNPAVPLQRPPDLRFLTMGLVLAQELGDDVTAVHLRQAVEEWCEPRFFGEGEFGYWFGLGENYPRGQMSAFLLLGELVSKGSWWRVFNEPNLSKFAEPTLAGVDYPKLGISAAYNDLDKALLRVSTYVATSSHRGQATQFRVEKLPSTSDVVVRRDGQTYDRWRVSSEGTVEIQTDVEQHSFEIFTGYRSAGDRVPRESGTSVGAHTTLPGAASIRLSSPDAGLTAIRDAGLLLLSGAGTCPCCA